MLKRGIKFRLIGSLVITTLVVLSVFFFSLNSYMREYSRNEVEKTIMFLGKNASSMLQKGLFNADYLTLRSIAQSILLESFDYLLIYDNVTHNVAFSEDKRGVLSAMNADSLFMNRLTFEKTELTLKNEEYIQYVFPVTWAGGANESLGALVVGISSQRMQSQLVQISNSLLITGFLLFLTLTLVIYLLSHRIVKPIKELSAIISTFASGNYQVRSGIKTRDEIGDLSYNFNFLAEKINEQISSIEQYGKNLEIMVEERTEELLKAMDDIKERDKQITQAEKIQSLNSVVSSIAHEINNPLAIISGNLQVIESRKTDEYFSRKIKSAQTAVQRIATLIDEINFFSGIREVTLMPASFRTLLNNALNVTAAGDPEIVVHGAHDDMISTNQNLLSITLENILKNSVQQFASLGLSGKINVEYYREPYFFVICISDNGGGVKEPSRVFEPFYTTYNERKGLGLTFAYHAIQALNGIIEIENEGEGAKVTLRLPDPELNKSIELHSSSVIRE